MIRRGQGMVGGGEVVDGGVAAVTGDQPAGRRQASITRQGGSLSRGARARQVREGF